MSAKKAAIVRNYKGLEWISLTLGSLNNIVKLSVPLVGKSHVQVINR